MGNSCGIGCSSAAPEPQQIVEKGFRRIIDSVFEELQVSHESDVFLYFKNEFMMTRDQFSSITSEQFDEAVKATKLHKNVVRVLCKRLGEYTAAPEDSAPISMI